MVSLAQPFDRVHERADGQTDTIAIIYPVLNSDAPLKMDRRIHRRHQCQDMMA